MTFWTRNGESGVGQLHSVIYILNQHLLACIQAGSLGRTIRQEVVAAQ